jgi:translation initiation factor 5A
MTLKLIDAKDIKKGTALTIDNSHFIVKKVDISTTGRHGHTKVRVEAEDIFSGNKKVFVVPGHERFDVPEVKKGRGQVMDVGEKVNIMDLESYETLNLDIIEDLKEEIEGEDEVEYWDVEGKKIIKRKL